MQVSVVIATYNGENYIHEQLKSILNQTIKPTEIIICDDCSNDRTWEILQDYKSKYSKLIHIKQNPHNIGYAKNFWNAIKSANCKIIFLSDQDDIWHVDKIDVMLKIMQQNNNILALSTSYELIDEKDIKYSDIRNVYFKNNGKLKHIGWKKFIKHPRYPGMTMALSKSLLDRIPNDILVDGVAHDWLVNQYASLNKGLFFCDIVLTKYRQHQYNVVGSAASKQNYNIKERRIKIINDMKVSLEKLLLIWEIQYAKTINAKRVNYINQIINLCKYRTDYIRSERLLRLIFCDLKHYPYMTVRSILGDVYTIVMAKKRGKDNASYFDGNI